jgi:hypothetical protein
LHLTVDSCSKGATAAGDIPTLKTSADIAEYDLVSILVDLLSDLLEVSAAVVMVIGAYVIPKGLTSNES